MTGIRQPTSPSRTNTRLCPLLAGAGNGVGAWVGAEGDAGTTNLGLGELIPCLQCWAASGVGLGAGSHPLLPHGSLQVFILQLLLPEPGIGIIIILRKMCWQQDCSLSCPLVPPG